MSFTTRRQDLYPLPLPPAPAHDPRIRGGRARRRARGRIFIWHRVCAAVNALNWFWAPGLAPDPLPAPSAAQLAAIDHITALVCQARRLGVFPTLGELSGVAQAHAEPSSLYQDRLRPDFIYLTAARAALPAPRTGATVPVLDYVQPDLADKLRSPCGGMLRDPIPWDEINAIPLVFGVAQGEWEPLVCRMDTCNMLAFFEAWERPRIIINGVFGVYKDADFDRVILDGRRGNRAYVEPDSVHLVNPGLFAELILPQGAHLYVATSDADNMFHRLRLPDWMHRFFALPGVSSAAVGLPGPDRTVYPALKSCPMGFSWAVVIAQSLHLTLLDSVPGLSVGQRLQRGGPVVIGPSNHAVYIDDLTVLGTDINAVNTQLRGAVVACDAAGLPPKLPKLKPADAGDSSPVHSLGLAYSRDGTMRPVPDNTRAVLAATHQLLERGECTGRHLHQLLGTWTWNVLSRRPALSAMFSSYGFIARFERRRARLTPSVRQELTALAGVAPLLSVNLAAPVASRAYTSDASYWGAGVCYRDLGPDALASLSTSGVPDAPPLLLDRLSETAEWPTAISQPWRTHAHINELEGHACILGVQHLLRTAGLWGHRVIFASDSSVMVGALRKGRSSSWPINRVCRRMAALLLATGTYPTWLWCPTDRNPADFPSRRKQVG